jgi:ribosome recycling factor
MSLTIKFLLQELKIIWKKFYFIVNLMQRSFIMNDMIDEILLSCQEELDKAINHQKNEYLLIRAGRANPHILDKVSIDYYGVPTPIKNMASITVPEARMLVISVWDASQVKNVSKAIAMADLGVTPNDDGKVIRLTFPILTEERRREIVKNVKKIAEETKITSRNARRDAIAMLKDLEKEGSISEDMLASAEDEVQRLIDNAIVKIDEACKLKEKEIMEV